MKLNFIFMIGERKTPMVALMSLLLLGSVSVADRTAFQGRVVDASGAAVAGAHLRDTSTGVEAVTDAQGTFRLPVGPGAHDVQVSAPGFEPMAERVDVGAGAAATHDFTLRIAGFKESVSVVDRGGYQAGAIGSATRTTTLLRDVPQAVTVATRELMKDQLMSSMADVVRYVPGVTTHQGENNRDQVIIRGNNSSADFFVNGVRDDVQYYRDLYNLERVEALKGPNAMTFGRGGGGGVINRVTKEAGFTPLQEITLQGGSFGDRRVSGDLGRPLSGTVAVRLNAMYEGADSFRNSVEMERYGVSPTLTFAPSPKTKVTLAYEHLHDTRVADRGIPSFEGRPAPMDVATYFGNPADSHVRLDVDQASAMVEQKLGRVTLRSRAFLGGHDRFYQNFVPGAVAADQSQVALTAYNNASRRRNVFNQTDLVVTGRTGAVRHTVVAGVEVGGQVTDNFRNTGFFGDVATSISVPYGQPTITTPVTFRQSATDADNHLRATTAAGFIQDQVAFTDAVRAIAGLRFDRFELRYHNNRTGEELRRTDDLLSPRLGLVVKPVVPLSLYASYSVSHLPSSGDQFSSLTTVTQQVEPEHFRNYELGAKWDPRADLSLTAAVYRLDRTNTRATDPNDPTRIVQTGSQRTSGVEAGIVGQLTRAWKVSGGYAWQDAFVTSATAAAPVGAQVAQVPHHTFSLWTSYQLTKALGAGAGVVQRSDMFAAIDNKVTLPGYARLDAAAYYQVRPSLRLQANVENLLDATYYQHADNNTNISPGSRRAVRVALTTTF
jgi:catecholate siderophore receptor